MSDNINDPTWLTQSAAIEILRYAVDAVCEKERSWLFRPVAKIDRTFARQAASPAFARALSDRLAPLIDVDVKTIGGAHALSDLASILLAGTEARHGFAVRLFGAMSVAFDYALRRRLSARLEWLDPWHAWKYFLPNPTDRGDEDFVLICAQFSGASAFDLGYEMLGDSPVLVVDTMCRMASLLRGQIGELGEAYNSAGVDGLVRAFDECRSTVDVRPHNPDIARAAIVYLVSGECCWGKAWGQRSHSE